MSRTTILESILAERERQDSLWGGAEHDDKHEVRDWIVILARHLGLACYDGSPSDVCHKTEATGKYDPARYRRELIRLAAVAVAALEAEERRSGRSRWQGLANDLGTPILVLTRENRITTGVSDCLPYAVEERDYKEDAWERKNYDLRIEPSEVKPNVL
jgi:hypothetical protein